MNESRKLTLAGVALTSLFLLLGCTSTLSSVKTLTVASGQSMLQDFLSKDAVRGKYLVSYTSLNGFMGRPLFVDLEHGSFPGNGPEAVLKNLAAAGYVGTVTETFSIVNMSGSYHGVWDGEPMSLTLTRVQQTNVFSGPFLVRGANGCPNGGTAAATAHKGGSVTLNFNHQTNPSNCIIWGAPPDHVGIASTDGHLAFTGTCQGRWGGGWGVSQCPLKVAGGASRPPLVGVTRYTYAWTRSFAKWISKPGLLRAGSVRVDRVDNLLLDPGGVSAQGRFFWHADLDGPATLVTGEHRATGEGAVSFGKQPDGDWVVTDYSIRR